MYLYTKLLTPLKAEALKPNYYPYASWEDLYREKWTWDKVVRGTHPQANCFGTCLFNIYEKDGIIWREEQASAYPHGNGAEPDLNPAGCQKGCCLSEAMYNVNRIKYPIERMGKRGEGRWKRIGWEDALRKIARKMVDIIKENGPEAIYFPEGTVLTYEPTAHTVAKWRFPEIIGAIMPDSWGTIGDLNVGGTITWGTPHAAETSAEWFMAKYILLWIFNPVCTRIPNAHFLWEARYNGAKVITISPDYSPSSIHADIWLNPKVGTDSALALGMAHVIVRDGLIEEAFIKEQTDLPLLLVKKTKRFLRESDLVKGGSEDIFYLWDTKENKAVAAPGSKGSSVESISLGTIAPALEGDFVLEGIGGKKIEVTPVFSMLKEKLSHYTPQRVHKITGINPNVIEDIAKELGRAETVLIISSTGSDKLYHGDLIQRSLILLASLTGNGGRPGSGFRNLGFITVLEGFFHLCLPYTLEKGISNKCPESLWWSVHGGLQEIAGKREYHDPMLKREPKDYVKESIEKGWQPLFPPEGKEPKMMISVGDNVLRRCRGNTTLLNTLWPKLELIVDINYRMDSTAFNSDIVLPASCMYEKEGMKYALFTPFLHYNNRIVPPLFESKSEWEIFSLLSKEISRIAREENLPPLRDSDAERDLKNLHQAFTLNQSLEDEEDVHRFILERSYATKEVSLEELKQNGFAYHKEGSPTGTLASSNKVGKPGEFIFPWKDQIEGKKPWPTLVGRQQFYIDHPWFLELGEELPVHKDPPPMGGSFPFMLTFGHTRWSVHSLWRDDPYMLRLQRGMPIMYMNPSDAKKKGIKDHDLVRVFNEVDEFQINVKLSPSIMPSQLLIYHAWETYQFRGHRSDQSLLPSPLKVLQLVGNYGHLFFSMAHYHPNCPDKGTKVDVERVV